MDPRVKPEGDDRGGGNAGSDITDIKSTSFCFVRVRLRSLVFVAVRLMLVDARWCSLAFVAVRTRSWRFAPIQVHSRLTQVYLTLTQVYSVLSQVQLRLSQAEDVFRIHSYSKPVPVFPVDNKNINGTDL
jgi:hypothetical protein